MEFKADVRSASALLEQFYEKRRLLIVSAPNIADQDYKLQNLMIQVREGSTQRGREREIKSMGGGRRGNL